MRKTIFLSFYLAAFFAFVSCQNIQRHKNIEAESIGKNVDTNAPDNEICSSFSVTRKDIEKYFSVAQETDEFEFNEKALILPCSFQGTIRINGKILKWKVYAGGAGYLYNDKTVNKRYLCDENCCKAIPNICR
jgi:hypothetical protein